jgi:hypothetical protein
MGGICVGDGRVTVGGSSCRFRCMGMFDWSLCSSMCRWFGSAASLLSWPRHLQALHDAIELGVGVLWSREAGVRSVTVLVLVATHRCRCCRYLFLSSSLPAVGVFSVPTHHCVIYGG